MTRTEHLLTILAEECSGVARRVGEALRFGLAETRPGQPLTNAERVSHEVRDLLAVYHLLTGLVPVGGASAYADKQAEVEESLAFSAARGLVDGVPPDPPVPHPEGSD